MSMPRLSPNGEPFDEDEAKEIIRSSEAAFAALRRSSGGPQEWQARVEFAKRFSAHVAAPLMLGYGFVVPATELNDTDGRAAVRLVEFAQEYWKAEGLIHGGGATDPSRAILESLHRRAGLLLRDPGAAAATGAAVCRLLRGIFTRFGIPAGDLPPCICAAHEAASDTPAEVGRGASVATAPPGPVAAAATPITLTVRPDATPVADDNHRGREDEVEEPHADGPGEPLEFWYKCAKFQFARGERRYFNLLVAVWPVFRLRGTLMSAAAAAAYEASGGSHVEWKKLKEYSRILNGIIEQRIKLPARLESGKDFLRWKDLEVS